MKKGVNFFNAKEGDLLGYDPSVIANVWNVSTIIFTDANEI